MGLCSWICCYCIIGKFNSIAIRKKITSSLSNKQIIPNLCGQRRNGCPLFLYPETERRLQMPSKTEEYLALACKTADSFSRQWEHWAEFLITAARLYKYSYPDQLMIYAQRPDATACAEYDVWNNKMNRYVRRGSKGIALLDESGGYPRLHYVFDVSDTAPRRNALYPHLWEVEQTAENRMQQLMKELLERNPAPDKEKKQMAWVQHMNSLKAQAEEMILTELIYS